MKLGVGTYTYMWSIGFAGAKPEKPMSAMHLLEKARSLDVKVAQYGPNLPLDSLAAAARWDLVQAAQEWGIEIEVGTRGVLADHLKRQIALAVECGATLLRTVPEVEGGGVPSVDELVRCLRAIDRDLAGAGVRLAMENSLMPSADLRRALEENGSAWAGITLDTVNSLAIPEGTREVAMNLAKWTQCLHVKDFAVSREWHMMGFRVEGRPAGQGQLELPWLLELLRAEGARCNAILELWPPPQGRVEDTAALEQLWAEESISYLRKFIQE